MSRESVRISFAHDALNELQAFADDARNDYLKASSSEKNYTICGAEFGLENIGNIALVRKSVHSSKEVERYFRHHLRHCMPHLNFRPHLNDTDA